MSSQTQNVSVWGFIKGFGKLLIGLFLMLQGIIGLLILIVMVGLLTTVMSSVGGGGDGAKVPEGAALVLNPAGYLVEQAAIEDPFAAAIGEALGDSEPPQVSVHELVRVIGEAKDDERIKAIVLDLGSLAIPSSSASKMHYVAEALDDFKAGGKQIIAVGDYYTQEQYLLAARADKIYLNDYGSMVFVGYGRYRTYMKSFFEKLKVTPHVFRVGTFKSAIEPFLRDDMSEPAKEANLAYLSVLWDTYKTSVETARGLETGSVQRFADDLPAIMRVSGGDFAEAALDYGLVDELLSRSEQLAMLVETFGKDKSGDSFKNVDFATYAEAIGDVEDTDAPNVAVVTVAGGIVDGDAPIGEAAGGDTVAGYLRKALEDDDVKAVVLRVDSPGGSAFASEVIRDRVLALKAAGKPVVVSMGSLAASGGYWVSAPGDEIWAAPTTITGSIGIFGFFTTFENTAAEVGVYTDGVGTSALSAFSATGIGPLPPAAGEVIQQSIEAGYRRFLNVVGEGRDLSVDYIDTIAQGRVWIGSKALELKLVDKIGDIDDAVASAAALAELESYDRVDLVDRSTPIERLFSGGAAQVIKASGLARSPAASSTLRKLAAEADKQLKFFDEFNDPNAAYARCLSCENAQ